MGLAGNSWGWANGEASSQLFNLVQGKARVVSSSNPRKFTQLHIVITAKHRLTTLVISILVRIKE